MPWTNGIAGLVWKTGPMTGAASEVVVGCVDEAEAEAEEDTKMTGAAEVVTVAGVDGAGGLG